MVSYPEDDSGDVNDVFGHYTGPRGGWASFVDGGYGVFGGGDFGGGGAESELPPRKLAGADNENHDEPTSLLMATPEHLEKMGGFGDAVSTIGKGIGEAMSKGAAGAGEALSKTWGALANNEDLHKGIEFGVKAAGEVTKDVAEMAGKDAAKLWVAIGLKTSGMIQSQRTPLAQLVACYLRVLSFMTELQAGAKILVIGSTRSRKTFTQRSRHVGRCSYCYRCAVRAVDVCGLLHGIERTVRACQYPSECLSVL